MIRFILTLVFASNALQADQTIRDYIDNEWLDARYVDNGDGSVIDLDTGLVWKKCSEGLDGDNCSIGTVASYDWKSALETASNASYATYTDWRLPNTKELASIAALDRFDPAINIALFPETVSDYYWSSTPSLSDDSQSIVISFHHGYDSDKDRTSVRHVRLVRN